MGKHYLYRFLLLAALFLLIRCSTEKNTAFSRAYHNMTAHYNVYFNGKESLKSGIERIDKSYEDDYSQILPIYKSSNPKTAKAATSDMENSIQKGAKLIQSHSITKKPKRRKNRSKSYVRFASKEEFNNWVDDAYLLMGKAYYYEHNYGSAIQNFLYVINKFRKEPTAYQAYIWLIKAYTEMERYVEAYEFIQLMQSDERFPRNLMGELSAAIANYYARQLSYKDGLPFLSDAVKETHQKANRLRYQYILAQWYEETGDHDKASQTFRAVAHKNPPYKMAFNARINAAGTFSGVGDITKLRKELRKMLRDRRNEEFQDQIYYAMGNLSLKEGSKEQAIKEYAKSALLSKNNQYQRALSCVTLGQIYYDLPEYKKSQSYYDSAMMVIDENYPNYKQIRDRYKSLTRLTDNLYTVEREDSLQRLAKMDEPSRNKLIDKWIKEVLEKEEKARLAQESQTVSNIGNQYGQNLLQQSSDWYFYNQNTIAYGKAEFGRIWGKRKLEDNWRRTDKRSFDEENPEEKKDSLEVNNEKKKITDPKNREYYTQDLPMTDSLMQVSNGRIRNALFNAGRIFKNDFSDYPKAIESFENLNKRYPENLYVLSSWFELWGLYTKLHEQEKADYYKNQIIAKYAGSKYAKYLQNPNYFVELEAHNDSINRLYGQAFVDFKAGQYVSAGKITGQIMSMKPDSVLIPKIKFLKTVSDGTSATREVFGNLLTDYIAKYPKAEPKPLAEQILKLINDSALVDYQKLVTSGYLNDKIINKELLPENQKGTDEFGGKFSYDEDLLHYFVIAYPRNANIDLNLLKFDIGIYNIDHYTRYDFDVETQNLNNNYALLIVRSLADKQQGLIYFRSIIKRREVFAALKNIKYVNFVASSTNFRAMIADNDYSTYLKFFIKNYSRFITGDFTDETQPEPEELITKAKQEENTLKEKGKFVAVAPTGSGLDIYADEQTGIQNFVIAVNDKKANLKQLIDGFNAYNGEQFKASDLTIRESQVADYQLMIVSKFKTKTEAIGYFTQTLGNRKLFNSLDTLSYRNFIITDLNLKKLTETKKIGEYLNFFKIKYIDPATAFAGMAEGNPEYKGPYNKKIDGTQSFVIVVPKEEINADRLIEAIRQFNQKNYSQQALTTSSSMLDDFRLVIKVDGLTSPKDGITYLRAIASQQDVYGPIQTANYRNFIITPENESVFRKDKNILTYMQFYKLFYLK